MTLKIAVLAPMPSASERTTAAVNAGVRLSIRSASRRSCAKPSSIVATRFAVCERTRSAALLRVLRRRREIRLEELHQLAVEQRRILHVQDMTGARRDERLRAADRVGDVLRSRRKI